MYRYCGAGWNGGEWSACQRALPRGFPGVFEVTIRLMSDGLLTRLEVLRDLDHRRLTTEAATRYWGSSVVRCFRLLKAYRTAVRQA